jgi:acetylornithine/N-succinyldiaminopimelate aminotransferase
VHAVSKQLREGLAPLGTVRGLGLLLALELDEPVAPYVTAALDRGLVIGSAGENTIRLTPPLTLTAEEAALGIELLTEVVV